MAPPRRGWAARTTGEARASGGVHPEGRNEMEQLGEAGLAARRGGPSRERRPDPHRGRPNNSAATPAASAYKYARSVHTATSSSLPYLFCHIRITEEAWHVLHPSDRGSLRHSRTIDTKNTHHP